MTRFEGLAAEEAPPIAIPVILHVFKANGK
jgi:hypothetical protein